MKMNKCSFLNQNEKEVYANFVVNGVIDDEQSNIVDKVLDHLDVCNECFESIIKDIKACEATENICNRFKKLSNNQSSISIEDLQNDNYEWIYPKSENYFFSYIVKISKYLNKLYPQIYPSSVFGLTKDINTNKRILSATYNETFCLKLVGSIPENSDIFLVGKEGTKIEGKIKVFENYTIIDFGNIPEGEYKIDIFLEKR